MRWNQLLSLVVALSSAAIGQQGQGGQLGQAGLNADDLDRVIGTYLNGGEIKNVLTPGEYSEWKTNLKAGQVILAEARSDAFDPALEVVDSEGKVVAQNDDRYPGDQRPLLLWRSPRDGAFAIRVRCFHDKSGGEFFLRSKIYDSVDLGGPKLVEAEAASGETVLLRIPMKAGEIREQISEVGGEQHYLRTVYEQVINPNGLPDMLGLAHRLQPAINAFMAPVAGDYYLLERVVGARGARGKICVGTRAVVAEPFNKATSGLEASAPGNKASLWVLSMKAGELVEVAAPNLSPGCQIVVTAAPDVSKYDVAKPETNPLFPHPETPADQVLASLPKRDRDHRYGVYQARRDAKIWIASDAQGAKGPYLILVQPAAREFTADAACTAKLRIGDTDYWSFAAKAGDVMTFRTDTGEFAQRVDVRDPDMSVIRNWEADIDQPSDSWRLIVQKPGTYLVGLGCRGDGGAGAYSLSRKVLHPAEFGLSSPAKAEIANGQVQVWRFNATPETPLLVHWNSSAWSYGIEISDDKGNRTNFQRDSVDAHNTFGILKVDRPQTFVIVLTGNGAKADYSIDLSTIPGYGKPRP